MDITVMVEGLAEPLSVCVPDESPLLSIFQAVEQATGTPQGWVLSDSAGTAVSEGGQLSYGDTIYAAPSQQDIARAQLETRGLACDDEALLKAIEAGDAEQALLLLDAGCSASGALHAACASGSLALATRLLRMGADPNGASEGLSTPLALASSCNHRDVVQLLLGQHGIDIDKAANGLTPLFLSASEGHTGVVSDLLEAGPRFEVGPWGTTPLQAAIESAHIDVVRLLLRYGCRQKRSRLGLAQPRVWWCGGAEDGVQRQRQRHADVRVD